MEFEIRIATIQDSKEICKMIKKLTEQHLENDDFYKGNIDIGENNIDGVFSIQSCCIFVAETNKEIIGFIEIWLEDKNFHFFVDEYAYIMHAFVEPEYRNFLILNKLFKAAQAWAVSKGRKYLIADVYEHNQGPMKILEFYGLKKYKTRMVKEIK